MKTNNLPERCTINEIAIFLKLSKSRTRKAIKKANIKPLKEKRFNGHSRSLYLYDSSDIVYEFSQDDIHDKRKWDCLHYGKCIDVAARAKNQVWPGVDCEFCERFERVKIYCFE